jgi:2-oxoacid:acceptor oxidoreductase gamma subunit (pyruvate/2-ketoisovalerate family)
MREIRFHGRGGQGAVIASNILANAAFLEGKDVQAFPFFGVERRGAPVTAFTRIDDRPIRIKFAIYNPDYVVVLDESLLKAVDVTAGLRPDGIVVVNTRREPTALGIAKGRLATVDATDIAISHGLGSKVAPIVNTVMLGALVAATGEVKLASVLECMGEHVPIKSEENAAACRDAAGRTRRHW